MSLKPVVKATVMDEEMVQFAIMQAQISLEKANSEKVGTVTIGGSFADQERDGI